MACSCHSYKTSDRGYATEALAAPPPPPADKQFKQAPSDEDQDGIPDLEDEEPEEGFNREAYDRIYENPFQATQSAPLSTFSIDVDRASYANVRRFLHDSQLPYPDAVRIEELINYFDYAYPQPVGPHPFAVRTELGVCPWQPAHQLLHIGLQGKKMPKQELPSSNLVFLLDVSGSMNDPDKLPLLKSAFTLLLDNLQPADRVAIVVYAGAAGLVLESTSVSERSKILAALESLTAGGSTAGGAGIELAYKIAAENFMEQGNNRVMLATDGDFNVGPSGEGELLRLIEKKRESGIFLSVLGFGTGNLQDSKMEQIADKGNGNYSYIDNVLEAKKVLVQEMGGTLFTIAKDVKIQIEFNPAAVKGYRLIGYENRMLAAEDFKDDKKDAGELGAGHTVTAIYEIIPAGADSPVELASVDKLKYQLQVPKDGSLQELGQIKLRYKAPEGSVSQLIQKPIGLEAKALHETTQAFKWAAAVAGWGMLLRESAYSGTLTMTDIKALAQKGRGSDINGYRAECLRLMEQSELLGIAKKD